MKFKRQLALVGAIIIIALGIMLAANSVSAERKGEDATPPDEGDWIIDSPDNYIGNETEWIEIIEDPPNEPEIIMHDNSVVVDCNIIIKNGGELTLFNATINMTDTSGYSITLEEGGTLKLTHGENLSGVTSIHNGNDSFIGSLDVKGTLVMDGSMINDLDYLYVNSSSPVLTLNGSSIMLRRTAYIVDQNLTFDTVSFMSFNATALSLFNTTINWNRGSVSTYSNSTDEDTLMLTESTVESNDLTITSYSVNGASLFLDHSTFIGKKSVRITSHSSISSINAVDSYLKLSDDFRLSGKGGHLLRADRSTVVLENSKFGSPSWYSNSYTFGLYFEDSDVTVNGVNFYRVGGNAIHAVESDLKVLNSNFWNITDHAVLVGQGTLDMNSTNFYNILANGIHLEDSTGTLFNVTMDEDDLNYTDGLPFPPIYSGWGHGVMGFGVYALNSNIEILSSGFGALENDAVHVVDSTINIKDSIFRHPGWKETTMVNGIYMDNSKGDIRNNSFHTPYRNGGFDLFSKDQIPMDLDAFTNSNEFNDGRVVHQEFSLNVRVTDQQGTGIRDVEVNLTNIAGEGRKISTTITGGWIRSPFIAPAFEIFNSDQKSEEDPGSGPGSGSRSESGSDSEGRGDGGGPFENVSFNAYHLIASKEYPSDNFTISTDAWVNIGEAKNFVIVLPADTPELSVKSAGVFPRVLQSEQIEITTVIRNLAEGWAFDVNISYYYKEAASDDWVWFGSDIHDIPGIYDGGNNTQITTFQQIDAPLGTYTLKIIIDPESAVPERNEANNEFIVVDLFEVLSKPMIFIEQPQEQDMLNGSYLKDSYLITGYAMDDYSNNLAIQLLIDGTMVTVTDVTIMEDRIAWFFEWDTTIFDSTQGQDKYVNGEHILSAICSNDNPAGYDTSDWFNITVIVVNPPELEWLHPLADEYINVTGGLPLYPLEVEVLAFHDLATVKYSIDGGPMQAMSNLGNVFRAMFDTSKFSDGYHTLSYEGTYGYGVLSESVNILLNSPSEETLPTLDFDYELTEAGLTIQGTAQDDFKVESVKVQLDDGPWILLDESQENVSSFEHFWERGLLSPDSHKITVKAFDGSDSGEQVKWFIVGILYDLSIKDVEVPTDVTEDDWVNFSVLISNTGPYDTPPVSLYLYVGNIIRSMNDIVIPGNSERWIRVSWHASAGNHTISAEINTALKNDETNPTNNVLVDGNLIVQEKATSSSSDGSDISSLLVVAVGVMVVLGIIAAVVTFSGKRKLDD